MDIQTLFWLVAAIWLFLLALSAWAKSRPTLGIRLTGHWGSVYVLQDCRNPCLFKVGMTTRRCSTRRAEVEADMCGGASLRIVYAVHMPYPLAVETVAHRRLKRWRYRSERGREWFKAHREEVIIRAVNRSASDIRRVAKRQKRWSDMADRDARDWKGGRLF